MASRHNNITVNIRNIRIADQIRRDISEIILFNIKDPRIKLITIHNVVLSADKTYAKVYFSTLSNNSVNITIILNRASSYIYNLLYKRLNIQTVPKLKFFYNHNIENAVHLIHLINTANSSKISI